MTIPIIPQTAPDDGELDLDGLTLQDKLVMLIIVRFMHEENGNCANVHVLILGSRHYARPSVK